MKTFTSKRHLINFYGVFAVGIFLLVISILMFLADGMNNKGKLTVGGLLLSGAVIWIFITLIKNTPKISIDHKFITFNDQRFALSNIESLSLTGKYGFSGTGFKAGAEIRFSDGTIKYIFDDVYSNTSQLKLMLDLLINNNKPKSVEKVLKNLSSEDFLNYKGFFIFSFKGLLYIVMMLFFGFIFLIKIDEDNIQKYIILSLPLMTTLLFQSQFNYFQLNNKYFRIKSNMKFWKKETYKLEDIKEITFKAQGKAPNCLSIIFNDYSTKQYSAATLSNKKWNKLKNALEKLNITVINNL
ncbi:hypothetical protein R1T16_00175 [Flavobacterium sp. DG1-102-2]|uniref:hypothetical protein n=1 Tax=Flavobacterium sp. DG1-102-2 TaxID=3081663 RepID=UPI0029498963|nr:hypothetical protein [Flavobacterium sp. DG1-102-2]MDV6166819.1 hypothetical protein [Flavobacterium sp. DG1-102-2]